MAMCKYCNSYVKDDETAAMDDDFRLYHPQCETEQQDRLKERFEKVWQNRFDEDTQDLY